MADERDSKQGLPATWDRFSRAQRISAFVLVGAALIIAVSSLSNPSSVEYRAAREGAAGEMSRLRDSLEAEGITVRETAISGGRVRLEVPDLAYSEAQRILRSQSSSSPSKAQPSWGAGVFGRPSKGQMNRAKIHSLEETVRFNPRVEDAKVHIDELEVPPLGVRPQDTRSASVGLQLAPGVDRLSAGEARNIRQLVGGAFNIPGDRVQVIDQNGNSYGQQDGVVEVAETELRVRNEIQSLVEGLYLGPFDSWEFRLGVLVTVDPSRSTVEEYDVEPPFEVVTEMESEKQSALRGDWKRMKSEVVEGASKRTTTVRPAGKVTAVRVNLILDLPTVKSLLKKRRELLGDDTVSLDAVREVEAYRQSQADLLAAQIPYENTQVRVSTEVLSREPLSVPGVAGIGAVSQRPDEEALEAILWWLGGATFLAFGWFAVGRVRRRRPNGGGDLSAEATPPELSQLGGLTACQSTLKLTEEISSMVRQQPDVAQTILRLWLSGELERRESSETAGSASGSSTPSSVGSPEASFAEDDPASSVVGSASDAEAPANEEVVALS
ncbi:MAG: hypothetical protein AAF517_10705 [Planctomycetota bacterium]